MSRSKQSSLLDDEQEDDFDADDNDRPSSTSHVPTYLEIKKKNIEENKRLLQLIDKELSSVPRPTTLTSLLDADTINEKVVKIIRTCG